MSAWPTCRCWLVVDKELAPQARALAAILGAPVVAATRAPRNGEGLVCPAGSAEVAERARQAAGAGVPLLLAGLIRLDAPPAPLAKGTLVVTLLPVDPGKVLRDGAAAASAAALAAPEAVALEDTAGWGAVLCRSFGLEEGRAGEVLSSAQIHPSPYEAGQALPAALALQGVAAAARRAEVSQKPLFCFGAKSWNHATIRAALAGPGGAFAFCASADEAIARAAREGGRALGWAAGVTAEAEAAAARAGVDLWRIEDGFLRSVGLGAGLARGASVGFDDEGIYFDALRESRMERLLGERELTPVERARGEGLIARIRKARVTKYNVGGKGTLPSVPGDRTVILVPGQVADDAGVRRSLSATIDCAHCDNVNLELLRQVRARNPQAHILFKPHPDVAARLRAGRLEPHETAGLADQVVEGCDILDLVDLADRVETFSSLSGFEALLRGKPVTVYGMPFYAGWGLTDDLTECARRGRRLDLATLAHVAFIDYPLTVDPVSLVPCGPEFLISRLESQRASTRHRIMTRIRQELSWLGRKLGL
ncbi:capsular polysaccharide export protein [Stappia indica]|uniref:Capsular polysaccharide export protein n=1 Tax=Stappia indica TaxID=538381 RepID=A0A285RVN5_9HYPH|nr:capsular polysaccharide export protein [Stappia indica]